MKVKWMRSGDFIKHFVHCKVPYMCKAYYYLAFIIKGSGQTVMKTVFSCSQVSLHTSIFSQWRNSSISKRVRGEESDLPPSLTLKTLPLVQCIPSVLGTQGRSLTCLACP